MGKEEIPAKLREAKSAEELIAIARAGGRELTAEQAGALLDRLRGRELTDEELAQAAGGLGDLDPEIKEHFMQLLEGGWPRV